MLGVAEETPPHFARLPAVGPISFKEKFEQGDDTPAAPFAVLQEDGDRPRL